MAQANFGISPLDPAVRRGDSGRRVLDPFKRSPADNMLRAHISRRQQKMPRVEAEGVRHPHWFTSAIVRLVGCADGRVEWRTTGNKCVFGGFAELRCGSGPRRRKVIFDREAVPRFC